MSGEIAGHELCRAQCRIESRLQVLSLCHVATKRFDKPVTPLLVLQRNLRYAAAAFVVSHQLGFGGASQTQTEKKPLPPPPPEGVGNSRDLQFPRQDGHLNLQPKATRPRTVPAASHQRYTSRLHGARIVASSLERRTSADGL